MGQSNLVPKPYKLKEMFYQIIYFEYLDLYVDGNISEQHSPCCHIEDQHRGGKRNIEDLSTGS